MEQLVPHKIIIVFIVGLLLGILWGELIAKDVYDARAIKAGIAQYNPQTAQFEWREC